MTPDDEQEPRFHYPDEYECNVCGETFRTSRKLQHHVKREHEEKQPGQYECGVCSEDFNTPRQLRRHVHNRHGGMSEIM